MKTLALALASGALVLAAPADAHQRDTDLAQNPIESLSESLLVDFGGDDAFDDRMVYVVDGVEYEYSADDITIRGDIAGGTNTLEGYAARAEATRQAERGYRDMVDRFDVETISPNKFRWDDEGASGPAKVVISLERQMAFVYRGDTLIGAASVSTARDGMVTPTGIFPVWLKKEIHYSQKYDDAPMPYMQMIDEYGIALHAGHNPGHPDSHGCIRLPREFAKRLYGLTDLGTEVLIGA